MSLHYNPLTDEVGFDNYMALYIAIKGHKNKKTGKKTFPNTNQALRYIGIKTGDKNKSEGD